MTKLQIIKKMNCPTGKKLYECSDSIVDELELKLECKLRAEKPSDVVNGAVSIIHENNNHVINIIFYEKNESPNNDHQSTFKKPKIIPTQAKCQQIIDEI